MRDYRYVTDEYGHTKVNWTSALQFETALRLLSGNGILTGVYAGEDQQGRARYDVMPVEDVVARAIGIARLFVAEADALGWLQPSEPVEE